MSLCLVASEKGSPFSAFVDMQFSDNEFGVSRSRKTKMVLRFYGFMDLWDHGQTNRL